MKTYDFARRLDTPDEYDIATREGGCVASMELSERTRRSDPGEGRTRGRFALGAEWDHHP